MSLLTMNESQQCRAREPARPAWHDALSRALRTLLVGAVVTGGVVFVGAFVLAAGAGSETAAAVEAHGQGLQTSTSAGPQAAACPVPTDPQTLNCPLPTRQQ